MFVQFHTVFNLPMVVKRANIDLPKKTLVVFRTVFNKHIIVKFAYNYDKCIKIEFDKLTR